MRNRATIGLLAVVLAAGCGGGDEPFESSTGSGTGGASGSGGGDTGGASSGGGATAGGGDPAGPGGAGVGGSGSGGLDPAQDPTPDINHPGDMEERKANVPIPFIATATDPQDGMLGTAAFVWTSDEEGEIGTGNELSAPLTILGDHVITVTVTDSDGNTGIDSITLVVVP